MVDRREVGKNANILGGRFVLTIKNIEIERPSHKARLADQGHADRDIEMIINTARTIRQNSVRIIVTIAAKYDYNLWTQDFAQEYLQAIEGLRR